MVIDAEIMAQNRNQTWRPSAILDNNNNNTQLLSCHVSTDTVKTVGVDRIAGIYENQISDQGTHWAADFPSLYQIWRKNVDRRRNYEQKSKSKMAAVRHLGFSKI